MEQALETVPVRALGKRARAASRELARADTASKNRALLAMAAEIRGQSKAILQANAADVARARAAGHDAACSGAGADLCRSARTCGWSQARSVVRAWPASLR